MINTDKFIKQSLALHLFFARIMKEHSLFLEAGFMEKDENFKRAARQFQNNFGEVLYQAIDLTDGKMNSDILSSGEIVTKNTLKAETVTSNASGLDIDENVTMKEINLSPDNIFCNENLEQKVSHLNTQTIPLVESLINFKNEILSRVLECQMFTVNYPLLIEHIIREAKLYRDSLVKLQRKENLDLYAQEVFWNRQMKEHAEFIRGLLDPSEKQLILTADKFANEYQNIMETNVTNPELLTDLSLTETINFKQFKEAGSDGILNCQIKSIIIPLLADHVLREANHFIRLMQQHRQENNY